MDNRGDIERAADALAEGKFGLIHFGNIIGLFCEPSAHTVGDMNEFKGSERGKPVSVTGLMESVSSAMDPMAFPAQLCTESALAIASALDAYGPVGFILPASHQVPDHLSVMGHVGGAETNTVQVITAGAASPFNEFVRAVNTRLDVTYIAATSANISSYSVGTPQPVHYRMKHALREFADRGHDRFFVLAVPRESRLNRSYPWHDARSTTIVRLSDVSRDVSGVPLTDPDGRYVVQVARWGSMSRELTRRIIFKYGYEVRFPTDRIDKRSYFWSINRFMTYKNRNDRAPTE